MRNLKQFFTRQTLGYLATLPRVFFTIRQPLGFLKSYITGHLTIKHITLRSGLVYDIANFDDLGVFYEIFIKKEYGSIPSGDVTIMDIGANNGLFMFYCKAQNKHATVHCFEPVPACADHIRKVIHTNGFTHVTVHQAAMADKQGQMNLYLGDQTVAASLYEGIASGHNALSVTTDTLAHAMEANNIHTLDFLKVDCEGGEYDIFFSVSAEVLSHCKYIAIEYHDIDEKKNGKMLYQYLRMMLPYRRVVYHHHPAHPHNGFITVN